MDYGCVNIKLTIQCHLTESNYYHKTNYSKVCGKHLRIILSHML